MNFTKMLYAIYTFVEFSLHYAATLFVITSLISVQIHHQIWNGQWGLMHLQATWNLKYFPIVAVSVTGFVLFIFLFIFMLTKFPSFHTAANLARLELKKHYGDFMILRLTDEITTMENKYLRNVKPSEVITLKNYFLAHRDMSNDLETFQRVAMRRSSPYTKSLLGSFEGIYDVFQIEDAPIHKSAAEENYSTDDYAASDNDEFGHMHIYGRSRPLNKGRKQRRRKLEPSTSKEVRNQQLCLQKNSRFIISNDEINAIEESFNEASEFIHTQLTDSTQVEFIHKIIPCELTQDEVANNVIMDDEANSAEKLMSDKIFRLPIALHIATLEDQIHDERAHDGITNKKLNKNQMNEHHLTQNEVTFIESKEGDVIDDSKLSESEIKSDLHQKLYNEIQDKIHECTAICNQLVHVRVVDGGVDHSNPINDHKLSSVGNENEFHIETVKTTHNDGAPRNESTHLKLYCPPIDKEEIDLFIENTADTNHNAKSFDNVNQSKIRPKKSCLKSKINKNSTHYNTCNEGKNEIKKTKCKWESVKHNQKEKHSRESIHHQKLDQETQVKENRKYWEKYKYNIKRKKEDNGNEKKVDENEAKKVKDNKKPGGKVTKDECRYKRNMYKDKPKTIKNYSKNEVRAIISKEKTNIVKNYLKAEAKLKLKGKIESKNKTECSKHYQQNKMLKSTDKDNASNIKLVRFKENNDVGSYIYNETEKEFYNTASTNNKIDDGGEISTYGIKIFENQKPLDTTENRLKDE